MKKPLSLASPLFLLSCLTVVLPHAYGQSVIGLSGGTGNRAGQGGYSASNFAPFGALSGIASALGSPGPLMQFGPVAVRPHVGYEFLSGTGILRIPGKPEDTTRHTIKGGLLLEAGARASADYTASQVMYSSGGMKDAINQNLRAQGGITSDGWKFSLSGSYADTSNVLVETGSQTREKTYAAGTQVAYQLGSKTEVELNAGVNDRSAKAVAATATWAGSDLTQWTSTVWLRRHLSRDLSAAAGVGLGYDEIPRSPDMSTQQPQVQIRWKPTQKISLEAEYGWEKRKFRTAVARTEENSRYSGSVGYRPFQATTISAGVSRSINPSYSAGQSTLSTGWNAGIQQRLLTRLFLSAGIAESQSDYESVVPSSISGRGERYSNKSVSLSTSLLQKGSVSVSYQQSRNRSSIAIYSFTSNQIGAEIGYRF